MSGKYIDLLIIIFGLGVLLLGCDAPKPASDIPEAPEKAPFQISVTLIHDQLQGYNATVSISADSSRGWLIGYNFLLSYDPNALTFVKAEPGDLLKVEGWDSFDFQRVIGDHVDGSNLALVHLNAHADRHDSEIPPDTSLPLSNELAVLEFTTSTRRTYQCTFQPIRFYWFNSRNNFVSLLNGGNVAIVENVYDTAWNVPVADTMYVPGWQAPPEDRHNLPQIVLVPMIDFINGGIKFACSGNIDPTGDINVNGYTYETADAVMFTEYFVDGLAAFDRHPSASSAASDVNGDGNTITVADLVSLFRVIDDDGPPHPKVHDTAEVTISTHFHDGAMTVAARSDSTIGAIWLVFDVPGNIRPPMLEPASGQMDMKYALHSDTLRLLIYYMGSRFIAPGGGALLTIPASDTLRLLHVEAATYHGIPMKATIDTNL